MRVVSTALIAMGVCGLLGVVFPQNLAAQIDAHVTASQRAIVSELIDLVSIPSTRVDTEGLRQTARVIGDMLSARGLTVELVETPAARLVIGMLDVPGADRTVLFYTHYDGQPVDPSGWAQADPFMPVLRSGRLEDGAAEVPDPMAVPVFESDWRLYGRSATDDKGPIVALVAALDALQAAGRAPTWNVKVLVDGDEESGSVGLAAVLPQVRNRLAADIMIFLDGPQHASGRPTVVFGSRGLLGLELTVYGPKNTLHSGHYGNWIPNPALRLVRLLASMKGDDGRVTIDGFYDGIPPLTPEEREMLLSVPDDADALLELFGVAAPEADAETLQEVLQRPSLNIRGMSSAYVGEEASNVIPARAVASLDVRLVADTPSVTLLEKIRAHVRGQGFHIVETDPDDATRAQYRDIVKIASRATETYRTSTTSPEARAVVAALTNMFGAEPVQIRTSGGTGPAGQLSEAVEAPVISVTTVNFDNNQHTNNENIRLGHLFESVKTIAALLTMPSVP